MLFIKYALFSVLCMPVTRPMAGSDAEWIIDPRVKTSNIPTYVVVDDFFPFCQESLSFLDLLPTAYLFEK